MPKSSDLPPPSDVQIAFGQALRKAREARGLSLVQTADRFGLSTKTLQQVESGLALVDNLTFVRIRGSYPTLGHWGPKLTQVRQEAAKAAAAPSPRPSETVVMKPIDVSQAKTFGEALRMLREAERMSQAELASVMTLHGTAVSQWESGINIPIRKHYEALLALFPGLIAAPVPAWVDMNKPGPSAASLVTAWAAVNVDPPPAAAPSPSPPKESVPMLPMPAAVPPPSPAPMMKDLLLLLAQLAQTRASADFDRFRALLAQGAASDLSCADLLSALEHVR